ncbi:MAG TPA: type II toxin-antitoxin system VapC family toxin [Steroidobacteraceae bacterium]|nr:type II toxin-antitoxin system VapC family toxin [Steroidobacteraceae bacterium]
MIVVLDASVILKWLLVDAAREPDTESATSIIESIVHGTLEILQPVHWLVEVAAVIARLSPRTAMRDVEMLATLQFPTTDGPNVVRRATHLAIETGHHLFDTLYHAVALELDDAWFVTADNRYYSKARDYGAIVTLKDWETAS